MQESNQATVIPDISTTPIPPWRRWFFQMVQRSPAKNRTNFGDLRRVTPLSKHFGYDRGLPIDRYYIENFLNRQSGDIRGRVIEIGEDTYTRQFGKDKVTQRDVLHVNEGNPAATFVGDLTNAEHIPSNSFDCFILTQTLHLIYDFRAALNTIYRVLKPGGVVLATVPGITQKSSDEWDDYWCWAFTTAGSKKMFSECFPPDSIEIQAFGNVLTSIAFLEGLSFDELTQEELDHHDPRYEMLITIRAVKPHNAQ